MIGVSLVQVPLRHGHRRVVCGLAGLAAVAGVHGPAFAEVPVPVLDFSSYAQVYGYLRTEYTSPLLGGDISLSINGAQDSKSFYPNQNQLPGQANSTGVASVDYSVVAGQQGADLIYNLVTDNGRYSFGYRGAAETAATQLRTRIASTTIDSTTGNAVDYTPTTNQSSYAQAGWNQSFYVAPTATQAAGSYGAILVGITLDGSFAAAGGSYNSAYLQARTSFSDTNGVSYSSNFSIGADSGGTWTGAETAFKKLLFQYGTVFRIDLYQYVYSGNNGDADFFNTGKITTVEVPFGATLSSGAEQQGLGSPTSLYGNVFNSATPDAENTTWDFGNGGGGFTPPPPVPEPQTWALLAAGLSLLIWRRRRQMLQSA